MPRSARLALRLVLACSLAAALGCSSPPVGISFDDPRAVHRELTSNVLTSGRPSERSLQFLQRAGLSEAYEKDPAGTLATIHAGLAARGDHRRLFALAELSFDYGTRSRSVEQFGAAVVYAYALLFPGNDEELLDPSDPRYRLAFDLYNRGLTEGLPRHQGHEISIQGGRFALPFGTLEVAFDESELVWAGHRLGPFLPAADLGVRGLANRYRVPGIGAPLSAAVGPDVGPVTVESERLLPGLRTPVTGFLRIDDPRAALLSGAVRGRLELFSPAEALTVEVDGRRVPIEYETTAPFAATLADSEFWDFELRGFFRGAFRPFTAAATAATTVVSSAVVGTQPVELQTEDEGLLFLAPYQRGKIPLVLVHGTASSPGRWADLVNDLANERALWERYQIWLFLYNTGNPVAYSGGLLREALSDAVEQLDPEGTDADLRNMIVMGHSQGGLLTKLTVVDSGNVFWSQVSERPLDELELSRPVRDALRRSLFITPLPFVKRVIFLCTPHGGSYLASFSIAGLLTDLIALPTNLTQLSTELLIQNRDKLAARALTRLPTSLDNMTPGNPFLKDLATFPIAPGVTAHSIIAVRGDGPPEGQSDGVVRYGSAHIEGVASELLVRSSHSAQANPATIQEVRRIMLEHAGAGSTPLAQLDAVAR